MYTQCPDCATAFRVTADILKQAGGKVRCGGCGVAFNALAYLSETKPEAPQPAENDDALPELTPDPAEKAEATPPPRAISPEQSAALLKTLDELAGSDIRLEDTGVEWRLLDGDDDEDSDDAVQLPDETDTPVDAELSGDTGNTAIDEFLDDTPAAVDEYLADAPGEVEASEVFTAAGSQVESVEIFDDDAGTGLVDEVLDNIDDIDDQVVSPATGKSNELRFDDNTGLPDDDSAAPQAASVVSFEDHVDPEPEPEFIEPAAHIETQVDIVFGEPDEWGELLDEVDVAPDDDEEPVEVRGEIIEPEIDEDDRDASSLTIEDELDALDDESLRAGDEFPESTGELESELARAQDLSDKILSALSRHGVDDVDELDDKDELGDSSGAFDELSLQLDDADDDADDLPELEVASLDDDVAYDDVDLGGDFEKPAAESPDIPEPVILPETEEEQTINRMIDQDLLRLAAGDDDEPATEQPKHNIDVPGFPSMDSSVETIIMEGEFVRTALEQEALEAAREQDPEETSFIAAAKKTFRGKLTRHDEEDDTPAPKRNYRIAAGLALLGLLLAGQLVHQSRAALATIPAVNNVIAPIYRMIGSPITPRWDVTGWKFEVTRETLSGGEPVATPETSPEAVDGAVADDGPAADETSGIEAARTPEILTIYSRLGNSAEHALPYPLITVSLTDRYEETIGSTVLEPSDYLPAGSDTSRTISPGNTFEAVIPIESPSGDATGYKLNVCYRQAGNTLRCAVADFK